MHISQLHAFLSLRLGSCADDGCQASVSQVIKCTSVDNVLAAEQADRLLLDITSVVGLETSTCKRARFAPIQHVFDYYILRLRCDNTLGSREHVSMSVAPLQIDHASLARRVLSKSWTIRDWGELYLHAH